MATHFTGRFNRSVGLLVGLALLVGLFVAGPATSQTADPAPDYLATFDACPEDVIPSSGFRDVSSRHANVADIDCIAYYGITKGTSATTYSPEDPVIREHMALFLVRMARLVGISVPRATSTPFTDISNLSETSKEAISQIYSLGITIGATATTYAPLRDVSRGEMALFLSRLMNLMEPLRDGRDYFGYIPEDVEDNVSRYDIGSPFRDLVFVNEANAVDQLYELGVAGGLDGSTTIYGPTEYMSRAAMAEFMAAILDHSNLRPDGVNLQVAPPSGLDNFDITMMISVRDSTFAPVDNQPVDWFYTDDEDGGLIRGECDEDLIQPNAADCVWDADTDDETDRDGNIFEDRIEATSGATMTFYAWIGRLDGDEFDERAVRFSQATTRSAKGADGISVTWDDRDIPDTAFRMDDEIYIVDLDINSIEFTIQLLDDLGMPLELEGIAIDIQVDSDDILLYADRTTTGNEPAPAYDLLPDDDEYDETVVTDRDGEAVFELDGPRRDYRLDSVTFDPDCQDCESVTVDIAWSEGDPVLVTARPQFDLYVRMSSNFTVSIPVEYGLYDQYGESVTSVTDTRTGRVGTTLRGQLAYALHSVAVIGEDGTGVVTDIDAVRALADTPEDMTFSRGRFTIDATAEVETDNQNHDGFLVILKPTIFSDSNATTPGTIDTLDTDEVRYADDQVVVWVVEEANGAGDLPSGCALTLSGSSVGSPIAVYPDRNEFRTCFTLWRYDDSSDRFFVGNEGVGSGEFEAILAKETDLSNLTISIYNPRRSGLSVFRLD